LQVHPATEHPLIKADGEKEMEKLLLVDMDKCTGCKQCSLACSLIKEDIFDPARGRIKILKKEDIALGVPLLCEQCEAHPCIKACGENALSRNEKTGIITVKKDACTQCGSCVDACPYHGIKLHPETGIAIICDLCNGDPYCVKHCVPGALQWVKKTDEQFTLKKKLRSSRMAAYRNIKKEVA
jgi:carbon-monoxide dehydrogenase iron sulfur subunit